jgi:hypothetical protein
MGQKSSFRQGNNFSDLREPFAAARFFKQCASASAHDVACEGVITGLRQAQGFAVVADI